MSITKKLFAALLAALTAVTFTACQGGDPNPAPLPSSGGGLERKGRIVVALPTGTAGEAEVEAYQAVADAYTEKYPEVNVVIDSRAASVYQEYLNGILSIDTEGAYADVVQTILADPQYIRAGKFVDMSNYLVMPNPHNDGEVWMDTLDPSVYSPRKSGEGYINLSFNSTMGLFYFNEEIFKRAGLTDTGDYYGNVKTPSTWTELVSFCERIADTTNPETGKKYIPFTIDGSYSSYTVTYMSWLMNTYMDQYFRDMAVDIHARPGDYCYDNLTDSVWAYKPYASDYTGVSAEAAQALAQNNDSPQNYTYNPVQFFKGISDGTIGTDNARYRDMMTNLMEVIPKYCQSEFTSKNLYEAQAEFFKGAAAITFDTTQFFDTFKVNVGSVGGNNKISLKWFTAPPMEDHPAAAGGAPAVNTMRSIGGSHGYYGVLNKNQKQNDLVMDYLMFWSSIEGQNAYIAKIREQGRYLPGPVLIDGVDVDEAIYPAYDITFPGTCQNIPIANSFEGLLGSINVTGAQLYRAKCQALFESNLTLLQFSKDVQGILQSTLNEYTYSLGYGENALSSPAQNPYR